MLRALLILSGCLLASAAPACETAIVLAVDVSGSISMDEYDLQMQGLAEALSDPDIIKALVDGQDALSIVQWSGSNRQTLALPWQTPRTEAEVADLAATISKIKRPHDYTDTAIGEGVRFATQQFLTAPSCQRHIIDVSGDGSENDGMTLPAARAEAETAGITINGVAIEINDVDQKLTDYYRLAVMTPDGFVVTAGGLPDFPRAIHIKLTRELVKAMF